MKSGTSETFETAPQGRYQASGVILNPADVRTQQRKVESWETLWPTFQRWKNSPLALARNYAQSRLRGNISAPRHSVSEWVTTRSTLLNWKNPSSNPPLASQWGENLICNPLLGQTLHTQVTGKLGTTDPHAPAFRQIAEVLGTTAISRNIPYDTVFNSVTVLGELLPAGKLGSLEVPKIPASQLRAALKQPSDRKVRDVLGASASEYLNIQFGWVPLIGDLQNLLKAMQTSSEHLVEFEKRAQRRFPFREETLDDSIGLNFTYTAGAPPGYSNDWSPSFSIPVSISGTARYRSRTTGQFRYVSPSVGRRPGEFTRWVQQMDYLYGIRPDVSDAWELTPFSWLVDWSTNAGDVLKNMSYIGRDGLVLSRAFTTYSVVYNVVAKGAFHKQARQYSTMSQRGTMKHRMKASPFGFGSTETDFSPKQWSILAALGMTYL